MFPGTLYFVRNAVPGLPIVPPLKESSTMNHLCAALLIVGVSATTIVQSQPFVKGSSVVSAGIGFGSSFGGFATSSETPGLSVQYEKGMWAIDGPGIISLGGYVGYKSFKHSNQYTAQYTYNQKWSYTIIGVRSAYHYNGIKSDEFDVYGGLMLSYNILSYSYQDNNPSGVKFNSGSFGSAMGFSIYFGGRYFFAKNFAAQAELGYGVNFLNLGLAYKF